MDEAWKEGRHVTNPLEVMEDRVRFWRQYWNPNGQALEPLHEQAWFKEVRKAA